MKVLLTAVNAKYIHSNLAILYLSAYAKQYKEHIELVEYTINQYADDILQDIYRQKPDVVAFSCYIWNMGMIDGVTRELKKVLPQTKIWLGGPEVSYDARERLEASPYIDGIMTGEGEETFLELMEHYVDHSRELVDILGIAYRESARTGVTEKGAITVNGVRPTMDLSKVPFPYEDMDRFRNKLIYYETSRGCPYTCSYCLSSIDKKVRIRDMELVRKELGIFLDAKVPQVKFVDRTFNCNRAHTRAIWEYIKEHDNGMTNFHFEVSADILEEEELALLSTMREGLVQLEIGVQSTNLETIRAIRRKMDFKQLSGIVKRIQAGHNIHQHLDLIVGLPYEGYESFSRSFDDVYALRPDQFQIGFLKVLKGSAIYLENQENGIVYKSEPPYEVLSTPWLTYDEVLQLKSVEEMVEIFYNSGQFTTSIGYLEHFYDSAFSMYKDLGRYYREKQHHERSHTRISRYEFLLDFFEEHLKNSETGRDREQELSAYRGILLYDLYLRENLKSRPEFAPDTSAYKEIYRLFFKQEERLKELLNGYEKYDSKQVGRMTHLEHFSIRIRETMESGRPVRGEEYILFDYMHRSLLNHEAKTFELGDLAAMEGR